LNLQVKFILSSQGENKLFFVKSEQDSPTLYFSFLPQFAHLLKEQGKGAVFISSSFILGLLGTADGEALVNELERVCKEMSSKEVKTTKKDSVKFDFKVKG
jgi:hypothetical protein